MYIYRYIDICLCRLPRHCLSIKSNYVISIRLDFLTSYYTLARGIYEVKREREREAFATLSSTYIYFVFLYNFLIAALSPHCLLEKLYRTSTLSIEITQL